MKKRRPKMYWLRLLLMGVGTVITIYGDAEALDNRGIKIDLDTGNMEPATGITGDIMDFTDIATTGKFTDVHVVDVLEIDNAVTVASNLTVTGTAICNYAWVTNIEAATAVDEGALQIDGGFSFEDQSYGRHVHIDSVIWSNVYQIYLFDDEDYAASFQQNVTGVSGSYEATLGCGTNYAAAVRTGAGAGAFVSPGIEVWLATDAYAIDVQAGDVRIQSGVLSLENDVEIDVSGGVSEGDVLVANSSSNFVPVARVFFQVDKGGTDQTITNLTATQVTWANEHLDQGAGFDLPNHEFVVPADGAYMFSFGAQLNALGDDDYFLVSLYTNGVEAARKLNYFQAAGADRNQAQAATFGPYDLDTSDTVDLRVQHNYGADRSLEGDAFCTWFSGWKL